LLNGSQVQNLEGCYDGLPMIGGDSEARVATAFSG